MNWDVPGSMLQAYVDDYAKPIVANAPLTVTQVKHTVGEILIDLEDRVLNDVLIWCALVSTAPITRKAGTFFMEKRNPAFQAR